MKRLKSSDDVGAFKDRSFHYSKSESGKKGVSSSSSTRFERVEEDRKRLVRKRSGYDAESYERRKSYDRYKESGERGERGVISSSPRGVYKESSERIHRSESFSGPRRDFPKGFRSERDRTRREGSVSSWRRISGGKDEEIIGTKSGGDFGRPSKAASEEVGGTLRSPAWSSKDSGSEQSKSIEVKKSESLPVQSANSDREEGELEPDPAPVSDVSVPVTKRASVVEKITNVLVSKPLKTSREVQVEKPVDDKYLEERTKPKPKTKVEIKPDKTRVSVERVVAKEPETHRDLANAVYRSASSRDVTNAVNKSTSSLDVTNAVNKSTSSRDLANAVYRSASSRDVTHAVTKSTSSLDVTNAVTKSTSSRDVTVAVNRSASSEDSSTQSTGENQVAAPVSSNNDKKDAENKVAELRQDYNNAHKEEAKDASGNSKPLEIKPNQDIDTIIEVKLESTNVLVHAGNAERHDASGSIHRSLVTKELTHSFKDKGKSVHVSVSNGNDSLENGGRIEKESSGLLTSREIDMEGPSTRGFDLFSMATAKKPENIEQKGVTKPKDEKLSLEPLELSLRLPSVLLPIGAPTPVQGPDSPSQDMSMQSHASSFQTSSDGFSRSFSGSQHYTHNPSCSLTETSFDFEQSVGSRPLFQGVVWQVQPSDEQKNPEPTMLQRSTSNGNGGFHQTQTFHGIPTVPPVQLHDARVAEGSYKTPLALERQLSSSNYNKQPSGSHSRHVNEIRSPTQSAGSHDTGSDYRKDKKRVMRDAGTLSKSTGPADMGEPLFAMVVTDSLNIVTRILSEMPAQSLASLKESARDIILNPSKRRQFSMIRKALEKRSDINLEMLSKAHRVQTEILVALKTGVQDFLHTSSDISSTDLAEIYLNLRCRNLTCRSYLPVDECDCKICVQKGFCSACMCLLCSKFDMASNTCSWVGCDVCLHWCHADCGIRESFVRNGRSATGALGQTEMQFFCVACDHPSEMFGFVKEVFQNFAKGWTAEAMANELEYVRRIFSGSNDIRGKRLHEISLQMLTRLSNKADLHQVRSYVMSFLTDDDAFKSNNIQGSQDKELVKLKQEERIDGIAKTSQEAALWMKSVYAERPSQLKTVSSSDMQRAAPIPREPVFDELDGIIRIKLAEAQMFQTRADDARREAEGLNRIAQAKSKKIDEEFASRVTKLHLSEAEENRRQKLEELQTLENAHQEYFNMKVRMEREIKDLLLKMEATKHNFS